MLETKQNTAAARVDAVDPVREAPRVCDAVDDDGCAGDRAACSHAPEDSAVRRRGAVEDAVVRAEEHAAAPCRRRRVHVRAGADAPEIASPGREGGERAAG